MTIPFRVKIEKIINGNITDATRIPQNLGPQTKPPFENLSKEPSGTTFTATSDQDDIRNEP